MNKVGAWGSAAGLLALFDGAPSTRVTFVVLNAVGMLLALYLRRPGGVFGFAIGIGALLVDIEPSDNLSKVLYVAILLVSGLALVGASRWLQSVNRDLSDLLPKKLISIRPPARHDPVLYGADDLLSKLDSKS